MSKEIIINADKNQTRIALVEDSKLAELYIEDSENERTLGDIFLGRVRRTMPSIQAAFIDIGQKQDAFLHYSDLADNLPDWLKLLEHDKPQVSKAFISPTPLDKKTDSSENNNRGRSGNKPDSEDNDRPLAKTANDEDAFPKIKEESVSENNDKAESQRPQGRGRGRGRSQASNRTSKREQPASDPSSTVAEAEQDGEDKTPDDQEQSQKPSRGRGGRSGRRNSRPTDAGDKMDGASRSSKDTRSSKGRGQQRSGRRNGSRRSNDDNGQPRPETFLDKGKPILVKIVKEPISAKGSRVSTDISLAGRFLVLVPLANYVAVSKKIYSYKERKRLRALAHSLLPKGFGVIVRTVAEGKKAKELDTDLRLLIDKWRKIEKKLEGSPQPPVLVHEDVNMASSVIRDLFSDDYDRILIDDPKLYRNVKNYVQAVAPHMVPAVQQHKGKGHIFKATKIASDVAQAFESRVDLPSGGYLFIEHTEAMHVVDVNSGRAGRGLSQEVNSLKVDLEAVHTIAKQIRLRDLGGIIVIDFIDLREEKNRKKIYYELRKAFSKDRAVTKILPMSDFGLVEITRQRLRPSITKTFSGPDADLKSAAAKEIQEKLQSKAVATEPRREPRTRTKSIEGFLEKIERWIASYKSRKEGRVVILQVHSFAAAFLNQKIPAYPMRWFLKFFIRVRLVIDDELDPLGFRFVDPTTGKTLSRPPENRRRKSQRSRPKPGNRPKKPSPDKTKTKKS